ncbi:MAG: hydroxyacylglutathione hydrolase [Beijerinckiaceae bacterium]
MTLEVHQFMCLSDNFGVLVHDGESGATAAMDAPEAAPILAALAEKNWRLTDILITHHHFDHTQGIAGLKAQFPQARVVGPAKEAEKIGGLDFAVQEGDLVRVGSLTALVIEVPGHTLGHIAYWFEEEDLLFAGDTLFAMGCGRGFEAPAHVLYHSLMKLAALPGETTIYCGHEYTLANARFALGVDPQNEILQDRAKEVAELRAAGRFTLPTSMSLELATNPFLRASEPELQASVGMPGGDPAAVFAALRERKNRA